MNIVEQNSKLDQKHRELQSAAKDELLEILGHEPPPKLIVYTVKRSETRTKRLFLDFLVIKESGPVYISSLMARVLAIPHTMGAGLPVEISGRPSDTLLKLATHLWYPTLNFDIEVKAL